MEKIDANTVFGAYAKRAVDISLGRLVDVLRRHSVARAVTCSTTGAFYDSRQGNEETLAACAEHPELIPAATINPSRYYEDGGIGRLRERGFRLLRLFNAVQGWPVGRYAPFEAVCAEADEAGLPVMLDVSAQGHFSAIGRVARRMKVPVIVCGCNYATQSEAVAVGRRTPNLVVELHQLTSPDGVELLTQCLGSDRVVYGSWAPLNYLGHTLLILERAALSEADRQAVAGGTIARILDIDLPADVGQPPSAAEGPQAGAPAPHPDEDQPALPGREGAG